MSEQDTISTHSDTCAPLPGASEVDSGSFEIDFEKYLEMTKEFDATEAQQRELIAALWQIMMAFMDYKYGIHPVQTALSKRESSGAKGGQNAEDLLRSLIAKSDDLKEDFDESAAPKECEG